jgi:hypothetical protein
MNHRKSRYEQIHSKPRALSAKELSTVVGGVQPSPPLLLPPAPPRRPLLLGPAKPVAPKPALARLPSATKATFSTAAVAKPPPSAQTAARTLDAVKKS